MCEEHRPKSIFCFGVCSSGLLNAVESLLDHCRTLVFVCILFSIVENVVHRGEFTLWNGLSHNFETILQVFFCLVFNEIGACRPMKARSVR